MYFYQGGLSWEALHAMPLPLIVELVDNANRINSNIEKASRR